MSAHSRRTQRVGSSSDNWDDDFDYSTSQPQAAVPLHPRHVMSWPNWSESSGIDEEPTIKLPPQSRSRSHDVYRASTPSLTSDRGITTTTDGEMTEGHDEETEMDEPTIAYSKSSNRSGSLLPSSRADGSTPRQRRLLNVSDRSETPVAKPRRSSPRSSDGEFADRSGIHEDTETEGESERRQRPRHSPLQSARPTPSSSSITTRSGDSDRSDRPRRRLRKSRPSDEPKPARPSSRASSSVHLPLLDSENVPPRREPSINDRIDEGWQAVPFPSPDRGPTPMQTTHKRSESWTRRLSISRNMTPSRKSSQRQSLNAKGGAPTLAPVSSSNKLRKHRPTSSISAIDGDMLGSPRQSSRPQKPSLQPLASPPQSPGVTFETVRGSHRQERTIMASESSATLLAARSPRANRPESLELLQGSTPHLSPPSLRIRPMTADPRRPQSVFSTGSSTYGPSENGSAGSTVRGSVISTGARPVRRLSMSDLTVPARISNAAVRIGQDLQRVRQFKDGIEELKQMRQSYRSLMSSVTTPPPSAGAGSFDSSPPPALPEDAQERLASATYRIQERYSVHWETADVLIALAEGDDDKHRRERTVSMQPAKSIAGLHDSPGVLARSTSVPTSPPHAQSSSDPLPTTSHGERQIELLRGLLEPSTTSLHSAPPVIDESPTKRPPAPALTTPQRPSSARPEPSPTPPLKSAGSNRMRQVSRASQVFMRIFKRSSVIALSPDVHVEPAPVPEAPARPTSPRKSDVFQHIDSDENWDYSPDEEDSKQLGRSAGLNVASVRMRSKSEDASKASSTSSQAAKLAFSPESMPALLERLTEVKAQCQSCLSELRGVTI